MPSVYVITRFAIIALLLRSVENVLMSQKCKQVSTKWTKCSKMCGIGVQWRVASFYEKNGKSSNKRYKHCEFKREIRLCYSRPCAPKQLVCLLPKVFFCVITGV